MADMRFSVDLPALKKHINFVRNGLGSSKTDIPVMLMRFEVSGSKMSVFCSNKAMFCRTEVKVDNEAGVDGSFSLMGDKVNNLIAQTEAEKAILEIDGENAQISVGFLVVNFETFDGSVLKTIESGQQDHLKTEGLAVVKAAIEEGLVCARSCTTNTSVNPNVTHVELRKGRFLSSDGRKIMIFHHPGIPEEMSLKVPADVLADVVSAVKNMDIENIQVFDLAGYFYVKGNKNEYSMGVRKVEREFPAVEQQLTALDEPTDEVSLDKNVFEGMLRGVALGLPSDEVKVILEAGGAGKEAYLEISSTNTLGRRSHERSNCGRKTDARVAVPVSFRHLIDTLGVFKGDSVVDVQVFDPKTVLVVKDTTDIRTVQTVIPYRTDAAIEAERKEREAAASVQKEQRAKDTADKEAALAGADGAEALNTDQDVELE